jgi:imidazole glycerol-phosphate synthase subunit HisH
MVTIIDYGMGNVASVQKALKFLEVECEVTNDHEKIKAADCILLPGVGSFKQGMTNLHKLGLTELLTDEVVNKKKKFLGICLGMQLIASKGTEPEPTDGLGWIDVEVIRLELKDKRIPHLGWNNIEVKKGGFFKNVEDPNFYFIHSYHFKVNNPDQVSSTVNYGIEIVSSVSHGNIFATQFHPEKSQTSGLAVLSSFFKLN